MAFSSMLSLSQETTKLPCYRPAKGIPFELREHCIIYFEEQLYSQALALLTNLLVAGTSLCTDSHLIPAHAPPPLQLALVATLVVHPSLTTRTSSIEKQQASNDALRFLQHLNTLVGPVSAQFSTAFAFTSTNTSRRKGRRLRGPEPDTSDGNDDEGIIRAEIANAGSLWARAEDFWHVVGWAFNCSVGWENRWERWKLWLEFMLDALDDDLAECIQMRGKRSSSDKLAVGDDPPKTSMIIQYLKGLGDTRTGRRRIMRAIFADGGTKSLSEFKEVFANETKERKKKEEDQRMTRPMKVDIDQGIFGDYLDQDDDDDSVNKDVDQRTRSSTRLSLLGRRGSDVSLASETDLDRPTVKMETSDANDSESFGGAESMALRQRFLSLLAKASSAFPAEFCDLEDLFDVYTEFIRPLPLPIFSTLVSPSTPYLDHHTHASLTQMLLRPLIASSAPKYDINALRQADLEACYLPYAANSTGVADNAKVGLCVEALLRMLHRYVGLEPVASLGTAIETGIAARKKKASFDGRKKTGEKEAAEEYAKTVRDMSALRMTLFLETLRGAQPPVTHNR
ncbi:hypothetical protein BJ546DRAFT_14321 [Cryomyces antarcticus]